MANPTRYHVIQKQKNQVKEYLSGSVRYSESLKDVIPRTVAQHSSTSKSQPVTVCSSPVIKNSIHQKLLNQIALKSGIMNHCENDAAFSNQGALDASNLPIFLQHNFDRYNGSVTSTVSPPLSSVATSFTSASEVSKIFEYLKSKQLQVIIDLKKCNNFCNSIGRRYR